MSIVVGYVDAPEGRTAVEWATKQAELTNEKLVIVWSNEGGTKPGAGSQAIEIEKQLEKLSADITSRGIDAEYHLLVQGRPVAEDLVAASQAYDAKMIVIGVRRKSLLSGMLLGSDTHAILRLANRPVVCVPGEETKKDD